METTEYKTVWGTLVIDEKGRSSIKEFDPITGKPELDTAIKFPIKKKYR